ncbi:hypothetical protein [Acinetobacter sp. KAM403]|uniref:hypothetical protein n=1 Tax=Acinetobacter sp. KAM403 TaxID=2799602 RepID=UPI001F4035DD|nr:hypothetical protein [Acinetobacter sp. KAM403]
MSTQPMDMRAGMDTTMAQVVRAFYGIESNFYDTNQNYIGMRLTTLKYSLIGPEYWVRFKYTNTTFKVEKSSY